MKKNSHVSHFICFLLRLYFLCLCEIFWKRWSVEFKEKETSCLLDSLSRIPLHCLPRRIHSDTDPCSRYKNHKIVLETLEAYAYNACRYKTNCIHDYSCIKRISNIHYTSNVKIKKIPNVRNPISSFPFFQSVFNCITAKKIFYMTHIVSLLVELR